MSFSKLGAIFSDVASFISDRMPWNWRYDPEWLLFIQKGDSPLLERSEWEYIAEVRHRIIKEAEKIAPIPHDQHLRNKLSVMKDNFEEVAVCIKESSLCKDYFLRNYKSWDEVRKMSIKQLKDIAKSLKFVKKNSAASRGVGSSVSLVGGLMCLVPGIGALRMAGGVLMGLGSLAAMAISILEFGLFRQKIKEAKEIMQEDREYSEKLWNWMNDVSYIKEAYEMITNIDVDRNLKEIANDLYNCFKMKSTPEDLKMIVGKALVSLRVSSGTITEVADVIAMLIAIFMLYDRYRPLFILAFETYKCKKILSTACNVIATTSKLTGVLNASANSELTSFQKSRIGIGIALDVISIIQASKDFDSVCVESVEIFKVAEKLEKEAEIFKKVYNAVQRA